MHQVVDLEPVAAATAPLFERDEVKAHLRVDHADEDSLIDLFIAAVTDHLDGFAGIIGQALIAQQWALHLPCFPGRSGAIQIPLRPLITIDAITYLDLDGVMQTLDPALYVARAGKLAIVEPAYGQGWVSTRADRRAVSITFTAGFGQTAAAVPPAYRSAGLLMIGDLYENRKSQVIENGAVAIVQNPTVDRLLGGRRPINV